MSIEFPHWTIAQERNELFVIGKPLGILVFSITKALLAQMVKRLSAMREAWVQSPGQGDPLEKAMAPTPVLLPGKSHGWRSLVGYSPWGRKESDMTE